MDSQPQNPEFRTNPENFHPFIQPNMCIVCLIFSKLKMIRIHTILHPHNEFI